MTPLVIRSQLPREEIHARARRRSRERVPTHDADEDACGDPVPYRTTTARLKYVRPVMAATELGIAIGAKSLIRTV